MSIHKEKIAPCILDEIISAIETISFGEVIIKIHNGTVVQLEKNEKKRFNIQNDHICGVCINSRKHALYRSTGVVRDGGL